MGLAACSRMPQVKVVTVVGGLLGATSILPANSWLYINKCHMYGANNHTTHNAIWHLRHKLEGLLSAVH